MSEYANTEELMTVDQVAALLGMSEKAIYNRVSRRAIPYIKLGGSLRFRRSDIERWIKENTVQPESAS